MKKKFGIIFMIIIVIMIIILIKFYDDNNKLSNKEIIDNSITTTTVNIEQLKNEIYNLYKTESNEVELIDDNASIKIVIYDKNKKIIGNFVADKKTGIISDEPVITTYTN